MGRQALGVMGLGFGDEGKGTVVDFLTYTYNADVVRFNGGPQAAHHVVCPRDGYWHCFSQIGSGGTHYRRTYLYKDMIVDPDNLFREFKVLEEKIKIGGPERVYIHPECRIVTRYHKLAGRAHAIAMGRSTTGLGVGMVVYGGAWDEILFKDLMNGMHIRHKMQNLREWAKEMITDCREMSDNPTDLERLLAELDSWTVEQSVAVFDEFMNEGHRIWREWSLRDMRDKVILEGAQGALLDYNLGFYPHVSPVHCQIKDEVINDLEITQYESIGVIRGYMTRHGRGVFVSEDPNLDCLPEIHNTSEHPTRQGKFRRGWLDLVAVNYGIDICEGVNYIFVTNLDKLDILPEIKVYESYKEREGYSERIPLLVTDHIRSREHLSDHLLNVKLGEFKTFSNSKDLVPYLEDMLCIPMLGYSYGPTFKDKTLLHKIWR